MNCNCLFLKTFIWCASLFTALFLFSPCFALAAITQVGTTVTGGAASSAITTSAINTTGATLLIMTVNDYSTSTASLTPSDSNGNTWTKLTNYGASGRSNTAIFYSYNKAGSALSVGVGNTFTLTQGGVNYAAITVSAWSGTLTGSNNPFDVGNGSSASSGTTLQPGSITPSQSNELIIATYGSASTSTSIDSSFGLDGNVNFSNGVNMSNTMAYIVQTTAGAVNPTWTGNYSSGQATAIASFKAASAGGSSDATLSNLTISQGSLSPSFTSANTSYTDSVAVTSLTVTPTANQANATIRVNGSIVASGSASGSISLSVGSNTVTIAVTAQDGVTTDTYTITVTRTTALTIAEVTPIYNTNNNTPSYTFSSTEAGTITYGGDCSSSTTSAASGNNTVIFNALANGVHTNCTIMVTDASSNQSNVLNVSPFSIDNLIFSDNFNSLTIGALDGQNGWVKAGSCPNWQVQSDGSGGRNITQTITTCSFDTSPINQNLSLTTSQVKADFIAVSGTQGPQLWLRRSVTGVTANGYDLYQYGSTLYITYNSGPNVTILTSIANSLTVGNWYTIEFAVFNNGSGNPVLNGWIYPQGGTRPATPTITVTDTSKYLTTAGYPGLGTQLGAITMDNVKIYSGDLLGSSVSVGSSSLSSAVGQSVTFTATVTPSSATGTVTFKDGSTTIGTGTLSSGVATYPTSGLSAGSHSITAVYSGDSSYFGSTSSAITQTINAIITITSPARNVAGAPNVATIGIIRDECSETFYIPYIQTSNSLTVSANVFPASLPVGGGVKFVMTDTHSNQVMQYDMSSPFSTTFSNLAKGEYTLDTYVVDSSQVVQAGSNYHDTATNIGIGDIYIAIGDSVTEGYDGTAYNVSPYTSWLNTPVKSIDNRNYPQCGISSGYYQDHWQEVSHHIALNNELESFLGYPVFILNEGVAGITSSGYITRMGLTTWQNRINALHPNKWLLHLGINDGGGSSTFQNNMQTIINTLKNTYSASSSNIILAVPSTRSSWQPYINNLISNNGLTAGPDFNTYYANHASDVPTLYSGVHPTVAGHVQMARLWAISILYPKNVVAVQNNTKVTLTWENLTPIESTIAGYKVKYGTSQGIYTTTVDVGNVLTKDVTDLSSGQTYYFVVSAYDNDAHSINQTANSSEVSVLFNTGHEITASAGSNGSISPSGVTSVNYGGSQSYTITPDSHYHVSDVLVDSVSVGAVSTYSFTNVTVIHTISVAFVIDTKTLTYTPGSHGTISGTTPQTVNYGSSGSAVTAVADTGYHFVNWSDSSTSNPRTDTNVTNNISVTANFAQTSYTLTYAAGSHGSITGTSPQSVAAGSSGSQVTAVPDTGYHFTSWSDGVLTAARTDTNVAGDISATASFAINTYTLTYTAGSHGTISGTTPQTVNYGSSGSAVTAVADTGYHFTSWDDGGLTASRTDANITANRTYTASFAVTAPTTYTITSSAGSHGSISPSGSTTVNSGSSQAFTITADSGYHVSDVLADSVSVGAVSTYSFTNVTVIHTISVAFAQDEQQSIVAGGNGYNPVSWNPQQVQIKTNQTKPPETKKPAIEVSENSAEIVRLQKIIEILKKLIQLLIFKNSLLKI